MATDGVIRRAARDRLAAAVEDLRAAGDRVGEPRLADRLARALAGGAAELDALPREDPFWQGWANDLATLAKLGAYARRRLDRDRRDHAARWTLIALDLARGADDAGLPLIAPELAADVRRVADAVALARWVWEEIGIDTCPALRRALGRADRPALERLARRPPGDRAGDAARTALLVLAGEGPDVL
ncbi:hypothetical protein [Spirillospora sp. NPDC029432]|uniref:hypothetical protein n=1 Tax=Spirillospora sp. NPDC029432 TaxID=3154599 RepID=UPI0034516308